MKKLLKSKVFLFLTDFPTFSFYYAHIIILLLNIRLEWVDTVMIIFRVRLYTAKNWKLKTKNWKIL